MNLEIPKTIEKIVAIAAIGKGREIGFEAELLWNLPDDLEHFKKLTIGHSVIMGRKTYESIGKALPERTNIVLSKSMSHKDGIFVAPNAQEAMSLAANSQGHEKVFIIGGAQIYKLFLPYCNELELTLVDDSPKADTYFPEYEQCFKIAKESKRFTTGNTHFRFVRFVRK